MIGDAIEAYLRDDLEADLDRTIVEGYTRMPQGGEMDIDEWGDIGKAMTALTEGDFRRLDEEEREAGLEPW